MIGSTSSATTVRINDTKKTSSAIVRTSGPLAPGASMHPKVPRAQPRKRLTWPEGAPRVGIHLGVDRGLLRAARRGRQIGAAAAAPRGVRLVLENSSGGGDMLGSTIEDLAAILAGVAALDAGAARSVA